MNREASSSRLVEVDLVVRVNFMVKLLRACVWMPWHK